VLHARLVDFNASLYELQFALMKACCYLAETLASFLHFATAEGRLLL